MSILNLYGLNVYGQGCFVQAEVKMDNNLDADILAEEISEKAGLIELVDYELSGVKPWTYSYLKRLFKDLRHFREESED